jgi:ParB/RepB/Spo0J family partition protein
LSRAKIALEERRGELRDLMTGKTLGESRSSKSIERVEMIDLADIDEDTEFKNTRLVYGEEELGELQESMRIEGLKIPIMVIPSRTGKGWYLRSGFRRVKAAQNLGWKQIPAQIRLEAKLEDGYWTNIIENTARAKLSTYEIAYAAHLMREKFRVSASDFARKAGLSAQYVTKLLACMDNLPREVLARWGTGSRLPVDCLFKWSLMAPEEAISQMNRFLGIAFTHPEKNFSKIEIRRRDPGARIRMSTSKGLLRMSRLRDAITMNQKMDPRTRDLCLQIVDYCTGIRIDVVGIYDASTRSTLSAKRRKNNADLPAPDPLKMAAMTLMNPIETDAKT